MSLTTLRWSSPFAVLGVIGMLLLSGCSGDDQEGSGPQTGAGKRFLKLGTAPVGGAFFQVGGALANVVNDHKPDEVGKFSSVATKGSQQNIRDLAGGDLDFALSNAAISYFAARGESGWDKAYDLSLIHI